MANIYNFSRNALLKRIGLSPGKKLLVFLISLVAITVPLGNVYNSIAVICFVLLSVLSVRRHDIAVNLPLALPIGLFLLMCLSVVWSINPGVSVKALGKEASLLFIPLAFIINRPLNRHCINDILKNYSLAMCVVALYFLIRALYRFWETGNTEVFFYHELSTYKINAIYLSALFSLALMVFVAKKEKTLWGYGAMIFLLVIIFLLSSKNIIIIDVLLIILYYIFFSGLSRKFIIISLSCFCGLFLLLGYYGKIHQRFAHEFEPAKYSDRVIFASHPVTIGEALTRKEFNANCYFNGTAFRAYQMRIFSEMLREDPILFTGYGLNASMAKIEQKGIEHKVYHNSDENTGYNKMNFHNQYIEAFADLGLPGFVIVVFMLVVTLARGISHKYFIHIAFAILMISLFLTESFLWRQRGVVFFTIFYCLFNDVLPQGHKLKNQ